MSIFDQARTDHGFIIRLRRPFPQSIAARSPAVFDHHLFSLLADESLTRDVSNWSTTQGMSDFCSGNEEGYVHAQCFPGPVAVLSSSPPLPIAATFPLSLTYFFPWARVVVVSMGTQYDPYHQEGVPLGDLGDLRFDIGESWVEINCTYRRRVASRRKISVFFMQFRWCISPIFGELVWPGRAYPYVFVKILIQLNGPLIFPFPVPCTQSSYGGPVCTSFSRKRYTLQNHPRPSILHGDQMCYWVSMYIHPAGC